MLVGLLIAVELFVESIGLLGEKYKPLSHLINRLVLHSTHTKEPDVEVWLQGEAKPRKWQERSKGGHKPAEKNSGKKQ